MANKQVFGNAGPNIPPATTTNAAGGKAYKLSAKETLAKLAVTGTFGDTYYTKAESQLASLLPLLDEVEPDFIASAAVYSKKYGKMKDMPIVLLTYLSKFPEIGLFQKIFPVICNDVKSIRTFVQVVRSGALGRRSLGSGPKRLIREFFNSKTADQIYRQSIGNDPSVADVIKLAHVKPVAYNSEWNEAKKKEGLFKYLVKGVDGEMMPDLYNQLKAFRAGELSEVPSVPFNLLTSSELTTAQWVQIAQTCTWTTLRMNLNTFERHGVFKNEVVVDQIARRLSDPVQVKNSRVLPYQLMAAYYNATTVPAKIRNALQDAMQTAIHNVPKIDGKIFVAVDTSGSMVSPITGYRGKSSSVSCVEVASLIASAILATNRNAEVLPFDTQVHRGVGLNPYDSVMTNSKKLASLYGGGTNCAAPLELLNHSNATGDLFILVSDNESWIDSGNARWRGNGTAVMGQWEAFRRRNPRARMVCLDITPNTSVQAVSRDDILNIGGFSDDVFSLIADFAVNGKGVNTFIDRIEKISLDGSGDLN